MKRFAMLLLCVLTAGTALAHGNNDHVRGTITELSAQAITVKTTANATKTLTLSDKTTFLKSGKKAAMADLKVGDRVVVDVPKGTNQALEVQFGAAAAAAKAPAAHEHAAK
jgi:hypothetical protein